jgi:hypothetical protein
LDTYAYIAIALIVSQAILLALLYRNYRYAISKYNKQHNFRPRTLVIVPCKGLRDGFDENISSFFRQQYSPYLLWFVVQDRDDAAYQRLCQLKQGLAGQAKCAEVRALVAGKAVTCSQKIHNLLFAYSQIPPDVEVLAFADSDICVRPDWLSHLVYPLRKDENGAASGYRWFIPRRNNLASLALSAINAKVAQLLGPSPLNHAWGGSMAIRSELFRRLGVDKIWATAVSDDLSLSRRVKKAGLKVVFVPACLAASYEATSWRGLIEFVRRQFLITRVVVPSTWWTGLAGSLYSVLGLYGSAGVAVYAVTAGEPKWMLFAAVPAVFLAGHIYLATLRQKMIATVLAEHAGRMKYAALADLLASWVWSVLLLVLILSSAFGRKIRWAGISYRLAGPTKTIIER